jgi:hypothetical protein
MVTVKKTKVEKSSYILTLLNSDNETVGEATCIKSDSPVSFYSSWDVESDVLKDGFGEKLSLEAETLKEACEIILRCGDDNSNKKELLMEQKKDETFEILRIDKENAGESEYVIDVDSLPSFDEFKKQNGVTLSRKVIGDIVGKHPNYIYELYQKGEVERVKHLITEAQKSFNSICVKKY